MARKQDDKKNKGNEPPIREEVIQKPMERVMHDSMMPYSEHVILERALPRVEDGLKPVQRRILFTMNELGNTPDKPHRKCARIVGDCLGKYHPHGDSSVYDALTRMAQTFIMRAPLVDGHGNFGSIDGDSPAAMRYTEARMTDRALLLLRDLDKDTVGFHLNFDDSLWEPDVLPGRFPNLLVNGATGIAVGLATNIPPHNMAEVINGVIAQIDNPDISTKELMQHIPAPDFPTGGVLAADGELYQAYETGRGKIQVRAKVHVEEATAGRKLIVIDEVPYAVNKAALLERILNLTEEKKPLFGGIYEIRDESDRMGMRAVIELRKECDPDRMLAALYKYSDLQVTFGVNMVAIADGKPLQLGLKQILAYYIRHQKNVVTARTKYDFNQAQARAHILEGLIIAVDNLDEVIALIRSSKNPKEARARLMERFGLTEVQAQAILDMRLQRLTNLEVLALRKEYAELLKTIENLKAILASEKKLMNVIKKELIDIRDENIDARRTQIVPSFEKVEIVEEKPEADDAVVVLTHNGFVKRYTPKVYEKAAFDDAADMSAYIAKLKTDEKLLFMTDMGYCYPLPVTSIPEARLKDRGIAPSGLLAGLEKEEHVVAMLGASAQEEVLFVTVLGQTKRMTMENCLARKSRYPVISLRDGDSLCNAVPMQGEKSVLLITEKGMALHFDIGEVSVMGRSAAGVRAIALGAGDSVMQTILHDGEGEVILSTEVGYMKRCLLVDFDRQARGGKGNKCFGFSKNAGVGSKIVGALAVLEPYDLRIVQRNSPPTKVNSEEIPIELKSGKGQPFVVVVMGDEVVRLERMQ